jgi:hypothetical protein
MYQLRQGKKSGKSKRSLYIRLIYLGAVNGLVLFAVETEPDEQAVRILNRSLYRPVKVPVKINYDADVLEWFRSFGKGCQTRINAALREYMIAHSGS